MFCVHQGFRGPVSSAQHECHSDTENNNIKKVRKDHVCFTKSTHKKGIFSSFFFPQPVMYANWCHQTADIITLTVGQI